VHDLLTGEMWFYGGSPEEPPQYRMKNGSSIVIGGMDKPSRIMSTEYDVVYVQEATELTEDELEHIITRLRNGMLPYQQLLMDCNPSTPTHWLLLRCRRGTTVMLNSTHE
jgi:phage terminase large subunit